MLRTMFIVAGLAAAVAPAGAAEPGGDPFAGAVPQATLAGQRGGTDTGPVITENLLQGNTTSQTSTNNGGVSVADEAVKLSGTIYSAAVNGNRGLTTVMQNTGDLVNLSNATSINIYLR
ncbi:MAG TPA: hypothetical protein HPQ04_15410 [Rhodospirillaceae bacterium]|nr:hypothetical protein [Rhodospirillaceae bacterium]